MNCLKCGGITTGFTCIKCGFSAKELEVFSVFPVHPTTVLSDNPVASPQQATQVRNNPLRVLVFAKGEKAKEALAAGADYVGSHDLMEKIRDEGWHDFDVIIATPDMLGVVGRLGRILDPIGLMPSPKKGTLTTDIANTVKMLKNTLQEERI